jgi:transcriptional regulator with XRE-family HTH domain
MLELSQSDLADIVGLSRRAILEFERGARVPFLRNREQIKAALEAAGVEILPDNAVRLKAK